MGWLKRFLGKASPRASEPPKGTPASQAADEQGGTRSPERGVPHSPESFEEQELPLGMDPLVAQFIRETGTKYVELRSPEEVQIERDAAVSAEPQVSLPIRFCLLKSKGFPASDMLQYVVSETKRAKPAKVLIIANPFQLRDFDKEWNSLWGETADNYELHVNATQSLSWLCDTAKKIRSGRGKDLLLSDYPREWDPPSLGSGFQMPKGTSLQLADAKDAAAMCVVYLFGLHAISYCAKVSNSQAKGRAGVTRMEVLVTEYDRGITDNEREKLHLLSGPAEQEEFLRTISTKLEDFQTGFHAWRYHGNIVSR